MGQLKRRNNLDLETDRLIRILREFKVLIGSLQLEENDNLIKIRIELNSIEEKLKAIDAQNKAMFKLYGVLYKILAEPEKPHDKFELFDSQDEQGGSVIS